MVNWLSEIIGYAAAILTTVSFVPQCIQTIKTKDVSGISLGMYVTFTLGVLCWLIYGIAQLNLPIIIANAITASLALAILWLKIKYTFL